MGLTVCSAVFNTKQAANPHRPPKRTDAFQLDTIPRFLAVFPGLSTVYIVGRALEDPDTCPCESEDGGPVTHNRPILRTSSVPQKASYWLACRN